MLKFIGIDKEKEIYLPNLECVNGTYEKVQIKYICILLLSYMIICYLMDSMFKTRCILPSPYLEYIFQHIDKHYG